MKAKLFAVLCLAVLILASCDDIHTNKPDIQTQTAQEITTGSDSSVPITESIPEQTDENNYHDSTAATATFKSSATSNKADLITNASEKATTGEVSLVSESSAFSKTSAVTSAETEPPYDPYANTAYNAVSRFIKKLQNGDPETIADYLYGDPEAFYFMDVLEIKDFKLSNAVPLNGSAKESGRYYSVTAELNIEKSNSFKFPTGTSFWNVIVNVSGTGTVKAFYQGTNNFYSYSNTDTVEELAYKFSTAFNCFKTINSFDELNDGSIGFYKKASLFLSSIGKNVNDPEDFDGYLSKYADFKNLDTLSSTVYIENGTSAFKPSAQKDYYARITSHFTNEDSSEHTVIIEYYGDSAYLTEAKRMSYTLEKHSGTYKLKSVQLIYDAGYEPAYN